MWRRRRTRAADPTAKPPCPICGKPIPEGGIVIGTWGGYPPVAMHTGCGSAVSPYARGKTMPMDEALRLIGAHFERYPYAPPQLLAQRTPVPGAISARWETETASVRALLAHAPRRFTIPLDGDQIEVELCDPADLAMAQVGYAITPDGTSLLGDEGAWREHWLAIGIDTDLGDPLFVDLRNPVFPVYHAVHGQGSWDPQPLSPSLAALLGRV